LRVGLDGLLGGQVGKVIVDCIPPLTLVLEDVGIKVSLHLADAGAPAPAGVGNYLAHYARICATRFDGSAGRAIEGLHHIGAVRG
jgi:hypothetical protein